MDLKGDKATGDNATLHIELIKPIEISRSHCCEYEHVFWDVVPCSLVQKTDVSDVLTAPHHFNVLVIKELSTSETSVNFYRTTCCRSTFTGRNIL